MVPLYESIKDFDLDSENKINTKNNLQIQTHCHNCGAPVNPHLEKCEYCGTYYLNQSYENHLKGKYIASSIKYEQARTDFATSLELFKKAMQSSMILAKNEEYLEEINSKKKLKHKIKRLFRKED